MLFFPALNSFIYFYRLNSFYENLNEKSEIKFIITLNFIIQDY